MLTENEGVVMFFLYSFYPIVYSILPSLSPCMLADFYKRPDLFARVLFFFYFFLPLLCSDSLTVHIFTTKKQRDTQLTFRLGPCPCPFTPKNKHAEVRKMNEWDTDIGDGSERQASTDIFFSFAFWPSSCNWRPLDWEGKTGEKSSLHRHVILFAHSEDKPLSRRKAKNNNNYHKSFTLCQSSQVFIFVFFSLFVSLLIYAPDSLMVVVLLLLYVYRYRVTTTTFFFFFSSWAFFFSSSAWIESFNVVVFLCSTFASVESIDQWFVVGLGLVQKYSV